MHTNRLIQEKSPYLLQHAHNPVDWYPWGPEAFEKARREDKPIFLSAGYSTCHWCHVMEHESFEDEEIAAILNEHFVPVKLDREERPDVDRIYMAFVQATTGSGGWPMSVWLTPDLKPFFGGTYFPPDNRWGRPGFRYILERLAEAWRSERPQILESGEDVVTKLQAASEVRSGLGRLDDSVLDSAFFAFRRMYDARLGGFGGAPKFPRPAIHNFLLRYHHFKSNREAVEMVLGTLRAMALGGMNDQLGGGFHRYSVDENWFVPHFEKMLYDQAQLAVSYLEAYQLTGDEFHALQARRILDYVLRDMTHPDGGFYSAEDADSVIDPREPHKKGEGAFYIWSHMEIERVLGRPAAEWFCFHFGVRPDGNVTHDPHGEFTGRNILYQAHSLEETARHFEKPEDEISAALEEAQEKLLAARAERVRPHLDDKILTAWNALMISAFALGGRVLAEGRYRGAARRAAEFLLGKLYDPATGTLLRRYRDGKAGIPGMLEDYAFFAQALLDLYESEFDTRYIDLALRLTQKMRELFEDEQDGGFFATAAGESDLVMRLKDDHDGAEPSGNSVAILNLERLGEMTNRDDLRSSAERALRAFASRLSLAPFSLPQMMIAALNTRAKPMQVILVSDGSPASAAPFLAVLNRRFLPHRITLLVSDQHTREYLSRYIPTIASMHAPDGKTAAFVCQDYTCQAPVTGVDAFSELLR